MLKSSGAFARSFEIGRLVPRKTKAVIFGSLMKIAVFASGNGSNFEAIAAAFSQKKSQGI